MKYQHNYSFLSEWMEINKKISINSILQALGTKSNNSLRAWEQGVCAMPVIGILRFCNTFQVPISAFICNTGEPCENNVEPSANAQFEPEGGYLTDMATRQPGERKPLSPIDVTHTPSIIPNAITIEKEDAQKDECNDNDITRSDNTERSLLIELQKKQAENNAEHIAQQQKLLDIIVRQQEQIERLTQLPQDRQNKSNGYGMTAES